MPALVKLASITSTKITAAAKIVAKSAGGTAAVEYFRDAKHSCQASTFFLFRRVHKRTDLEKNVEKRQEQEKVRTLSPPMSHKKGSRIYPNNFSTLITPLFLSRA